MIYFEEETQDETYWFERTCYQAKEDTEEEAQEAQKKSTQVHQKTRIYYGSITEEGYVTYEYTEYYGD